MLTDFVRGLKVVTPGQQPPKSITPVEAELLVTKVRDCRFHTGEDMLTPVVGALDGAPHAQGAHARP